MATFHISLPFFSFCLLFSLLLLSFTTLAVSTTPTVYPSPSRTPRPGTVNFLWRKSAFSRLRDGSPLWVLFRFCAMNDGLTSWQSGINIDRSLHGCLSQCLSIINGSSCTLWDSNTWNARPPSSQDCAIGCGAKLLRVDAISIQTNASTTTVIFSIPTISPSPSPSASPEQIFGLPTLSISPSPSHTPRPGTVKFQWRESTVHAFSDGSPMWLLWRFCAMNDGRRSGMSGTYVDRALHSCLSPCLSSINGSYCTLWNSSTWGRGPPTTQDCAVGCGAKSLRVDAIYLPSNTSTTVGYYTLPSISPSPTISTVPIFGLPRISNESDLPELDVDQGPTENSQHTTDNLEFYVYEGLITANASAGIRSNFSIAQDFDFSSRQLYATNFLSSSVRSLSDCAQSKCATRVRVWSDNTIGKGVVFNAVRKLRKRPGFRQVYTIFWTKIKRIRLSDREWSVKIPFSRAYQQTFAGNND